MNDRDIISILSDFFDLVFEVDSSELADVALLEVVNGFGFCCPQGQNHQD
jgi:hypothetical protein